jgi:hypothetical protein
VRGGNTITLEQVRGVCAARPASITPCVPSNLWICGWVGGSGRANDLRERPSLLMATTLVCEEASELTGHNPPHAQLVCRTHMCAVSALRMLSFVASCVSST